MKRKGQRVAACAASVGDKRSSYIDNGQYYAFTFKRMGDSLPSSDEYEQWLHLCRLRGMDIKQYVYELDSERRLHVHGTAIMKDYKKERYILKTMHKEIVDIPSHEDLIIWTNYIEKQFENQYQQEQLCQTNDLHIAYPFI